MKILQYRGHSLVSKAIRFQTRSIYSHSAIQFSDRKVIEAWHTGGKRPWHGSVRMIESPFDGHSRGTQIDVFSVDSRCDYDEAGIRRRAEEEIGKRYDFGAVARFLSRRDGQKNDKWFCSELVAFLTAHGGLHLLHAPPSKLSPRDIALSPVLFYETTLGG